MDNLQIELLITTAVNNEAPYFAPREKHLKVQYASNKLGVCCDSTLTTDLTFLDVCCAPACRLFVPRSGEAEYVTRSFFTNLIFPQIEQNGSPSLQLPWALLIRTAGS